MAQVNQAESLSSFDSLYNGVLVPTAGRDFCTMGWWEARNHGLQGFCYVLRNISIPMTSDTSIIFKLMITIFISIQNVRAIWT